MYGLAVAALTALAVFMAGGVLIRKSMGDRVKERLANEVHLLADWLADDPDLLPDEPPGAGVLPGPIDAFTDKAGERLGLRVTVVASDGRVIGDSARDGEDLLREDNHAGRPEIVEAGRHGLGTSVRTSATVHDELFYMARRIQRDGRIVGFVRLAIPVQEIQRVTGGYSETLALMSFLILIAVSAAGYVAARRFSRPVEEMSRTADAIAAGRRDLEVVYSSGDEIGRLGAALNRMTRALSEQIEALSSEKALRDTILGGMKEGLLVVDLGGRVLLCNEALRAILGLRGLDPSGRPLIEIARDHAVIDRFDAALLRGEESTGIVLSGAAVERSFEIGVSPLMAPGGAQVGAIGLFVDTTRLNALERVRRDFVADVSHELRTPLTAIKAFVETLLSGGLEDEVNARRFLEIVAKHTSRMEAILDDLTDLSLIETGAVALEPESVVVLSMAQDLVESLRLKAESRGVALQVDVPSGTIVLADRRRLEQILVNLLDNAIKFNRPGGNVILRARAPRNALDMVRIEVEDTGRGIPVAALDKVFLRFYRVERVRSGEVEGTGLGLSIVKHLMQLHGGSVRVESDLGRGSRFILEFPARIATSVS